MKSSQFSTQNKFQEQGKAIAQAMHEKKVEVDRNIARAAKRRDTMLRNEAERILSGGVQYRRP